MRANLSRLAPVVAFPVLLTLAAWARADSPTARKGETNRVVEIALDAGHPIADPFRSVEVDATFTTPSGKSIRIPGFWAGGNAWKIRYASPEVGVHRFVTSCNKTGEVGLHEVKGEVEIVPGAGTNSLYRHGPLRVAADRRHLEQADGTPFLWLGDTWWMGLCDRLRFPDEFRTLAADRHAKGFNVVQIVAGLYPDMPAFDPRGRNEAGFPWAEKYTTIRPEYFDRADARLNELVDHELLPCVVMAWGYHLPWTGIDAMKRHVRYVIARYGALPVVWCMAGEVNLPYYLEPGFPKGGEKQTKDWEEVIRYARSINGLGRLMTVHPTGIEPLSGRLLYPDQGLFDFDMLQTGHGQREVLAPTIHALRASLEARPIMPVVNGEVAYEALLGTIPAEIPRMMFWSCVLSGAAGHTYGANGIWQLNRRDQPYGKSPHGGNYGLIPWDEAMNLPGSKQIGQGKQFLERYPWPRFEPHPEWATWAGSENHLPAEEPYTAGIPGDVRITYVPLARAVRLTHLAPGGRFTRSVFDPVQGTTIDGPPVQADAAGAAQVEPPAGTKGDWVLVVKPEAATPR
ncbi:apiosidase-like domain-containing protein [Aquisphaera insulae]|uniref:apiosidase-like domain-containing protein n=1 Tax=Aquisphaera insulae TaxID=2712864 RepID=UPI0013EC23F9|nr:DUF4038 domain-containing protein [Aquisphaera insulae]